jgi:hypothetical protein
VELLFHQVQVEQEILRQLVHHKDLQEEMHQVQDVLMEVVEEDLLLLDQMQELILVQEEQEEQVQQIQYQVHQ